MPDWWQTFFDTAYLRLWEAPYPTRTAFQAAALPAGARVMMEVVALFPE